MPEVMPASEPGRSPDRGVSKALWKIRGATAGDALKAIDGDPKTFWHTHPIEGEKNPPLIDKPLFPRDTRHEA